MLGESKNTIKYVNYILISAISCPDRAHEGRLGLEDGSPQFPPNKGILA